MNARSATQRPQLAAARSREQELAGSTVVVIDLLRATSTICQALASGRARSCRFARSTKRSPRPRRPAATTSCWAASGAAADRWVSTSAIRRRNTRREAVGGRRVFITTTNGTRALHHARLAQRVVVGAFVNLSAVVASVKDEPRVDILCAGTDGEETRKTSWPPARSSSGSCRSSTANWKLNDAAAAARATNGGCWSARPNWRAARFSEQLALELRDTPGGRNLHRIGNDARPCRLRRRSIGSTSCPNSTCTNWRITVRKRKIRRGRRSPTNGGKMAAFQ